MDLKFRGKGVQFKPLQLLEKNMRKITEILDKKKTTLSFEFFPPKTAEGSVKLFSIIGELKTLKPSFVRVTYGAGGSTREMTHDLVVRIQKELDICVVSPLTCVSATTEDIRNVLKSYYDSGIRNIMALRGDPPQGKNYFEVTEGGFMYAGELVGFIKKNFPDMGIGVAGFPEGHPSTPNRLMEIEYLKAKVDAGADYICTQLFFDNHDFYDFRERCGLAGINVPIIAGIMPVTSVKNMQRMADLAAGSRFPAGLLKGLKRAGDNEDYVRKVGLHWAAEQVRDLLHEGVAGIHFYTLNKSEDILEICKSTGIHSSESL